MMAHSEDASVPYDPGDNHAQSPRSVRIKDKHEDSLLAIDGVVGVGVGSDDSGADVILVYLRDAAAAFELPKQLDGIDVVPVVSGEINAQ